jgi:hypothetical protein
VILQTPSINMPGTYFISASASVALASAPLPDFVFCWATTTSLAPYSGFYASVNDGVGGFQTLSVTDVLAVSEGDNIQLQCYDGGTESTYVINASLNATLINEPNGQGSAAPGKHGRANPAEHNAQSRK